MMSLLLLMAHTSSYSKVLGLLVVFLALALLVGDTANSHELNGVFLMDLVSWGLVMLTVYVVVMMLLMSSGVKCEAVMGLMSLALGVVLVLTFTVSNFFFFFFLFESALIPVIFLILMWGYQPERLGAVNYMVIYTSVGSFAFLFGLSSLVYWGMSENMCSIFNGMEKSVNVFFGFYLLGFLVKLPVFPFHLWLPKAHVEAPVMGSMILAGVLLKLGGYGVFRYLWCVSAPVNGVFFSFMMSTVLFGGLLASVVCLSQVDLKSLVAYSSVSHMSFVVIGLFSQCESGLVGSLVMMLGHGLCSSGLFCLVHVFYCTSGSRSVLLNSGLLKCFPMLGALCFMLSAGNMAAPPSMNYIGEVFLYISSVLVSCFFTVILGLVSFFSAWYSLYLYATCCHGKSSNLVFKGCGVSLKEALVLLFHLLPFYGFIVFV
nr:NADH dehydrogenase subunit 4 [Semimytilus algosus]